MEVGHITPEIIIIAAGLAVIVGALLIRASLKSHVVHEGFVALHYRDGKYVGLLEPGRYRFWGERDVIDVIDVRLVSQVVGNQEVTTKDGVPVKVSLIVTFGIADPYLYRTKFFDSVTELHLAVQTSLRDAVQALDVEEFTENRAQVSAPVEHAVREVAKDIGIEIKSVRVRDVIIGGGIKAAMADVVKAQYEGRAALERARAEMATMRSLSNTARLLDEHPALAQLRLLQAVEAGKATVVISETSLTGISAKG